MLKKVLALAGLTASLALVGAPAAQASGQACYSVTVVANGDTVVDQAGCQPIG